LSFLTSLLDWLLNGGLSDLRQLLEILVALVAKIMELLGGFPAPPSI